MKLVFTGGHHSSALPIIDELKSRYPDSEIYWIGHKFSLRNDTNETLEYKEITARQIPFYELKTGKVYRVYNPLILAKVLSGFVRAYSLLKEIKPDIIVSFGGYLAAPVVVAAYFQNIPSVTHEQTLVVGYANKVISLFAKKILLSWESSKQYFKNNKTVVTGIPLRKEIFKVNSSVFNANNNLPYIFILGGKSGSHVLNSVVLEALPTLLSKYNVIHQCGDYSVYNDSAQAENKYAHIKSSVPGVYFAKKFILEHEIGEAYNKAAVVVSRSGAHTIAEILALHKRALFIPIPWVSHNEQNINANYVVEKGLARVLKEEGLSAESLTKEIELTLNEINPSKITETLISLDAPSLIVNEIISTVKDKKN